MIYLHFLLMERQSLRYLPYLKLKELWHWLANFLYNSPKQ